MTNLRKEKRRLELESLETRCLLATGPQLIGIQPNDGSLLRDGDYKTVGPVDLTFRFDENSVIDTNTLGAIQVTRSGGDGIFGNGNDVRLTPGFVGLGETSHEVIYRFAESLVDDTYRLDILGTGPSPLRNAAGQAFNTGQDFRLGFELDLGPQVVAVVPQPVTRLPNGKLSQARDQIQVYLNSNDKLFVANDAQGQPTTNSAENPAFYQLFLTNDTARNTDDQRFTPTRVQYNAAADLLTLTFAQPIDQLAGKPGTFRLRIGTSEAVPLPPVNLTPSQDPGSMFTAPSVFNVGTLSSQSVVIAEQIVNTTPYTLDYPGANSEAGHRDIAIEQHILGGVAGREGLDTAGDRTDGITSQFYNFQDLYGFDPDGNILRNVITENEKERAREVFELYSKYLGIKFIETKNLGFTIATGDLRALDPNVPTGPGGVLGLAGGSRAIMDASEAWDDGYAGNWFKVAMHEIGHLLGLGHSTELPPLTIQSGILEGGAIGQVLGFDNPTEPDFPGDADIIHGQYKYRPESKDIDLHKFTLSGKGKFTAETFAQRLLQSSLLNTQLTLYRDVPGGIPELVARNDDYFAHDSLLALDLEPGTYYVAVSASGNRDFDPMSDDTGIGGTSQGAYQLRLTFRPDVVRTITDADNPPRADRPEIVPTSLDGDGDGISGGVYNFWFRAAAPLGQERPGDSRTVFVDKSAPAGGTGSLASPLNNIANPNVANNAFAVARPGDIVRIVGNGGADGRIDTLSDNMAYEIGFPQVAGPQRPPELQDGSTMSVPKGVTVMVDAGAIFKVRKSSIVVGSTTLAVDRSGAALQVLGIPGSSVVFTSYNDQSIGVDTDPLQTTPAPEDWGGISFRQNFDRAADRFTWENQGIFLDYVNHARLQYGGGRVVIDSQEQVINPIHMTRARPTVTYNELTRNADAAMSADPDSFEESNFHDPLTQRSGAFTADFDRIGPQIQGNLVVNNSTNGLFIRVLTPAGDILQPMTVSGRWDDKDIVHVIGQTLRIAGAPGGPSLEADAPPAILITVRGQTGGTLPAGAYNYRITHVDAAGNEGPASDVTASVTLSVGQGSILLDQLPAAPAPFTGRNVYRLNPATGQYVRVQRINASDTQLLDTGVTEGAPLNAVTGLLRPRFNARLAIDPELIVKLGGSSIEVGLGAQFLAEAQDGREIIFTGRTDDRYGAGGTFDTDNGGPTTAAPGAWGGIFVAQNAIASIDHALLTYGGGIVPANGSFIGYNALEIHQADVRVTNSIFENNASGIGGQGPANRFGREFNEAATIFVRGAQPVIVGNTVRSNQGAVISVNANSLNASYVHDYGRNTGRANAVDDFLDNQGPLIRANRIDANSINGLDIRGETLATEGVWDDTDIVHVLRETVYVTDFHTFGGLRLESSPTQSLIVKLQGANAGFTATGRPLDIDDRIGGALRIVGQPGTPVVFTSLADDTVGAGINSRTLGSQLDTNNDGNRSAPRAGDWRGILLDQFAHDRNVETTIEAESKDEKAPGSNAVPTRAQAVGDLAAEEKSGDDNLRLGFEVHGLLNDRDDVDVYSFTGVAGTEIWLDMDRTRHALDSVIELIDATGNVVARSNNSPAEQARTEQIFEADPNLIANVLNKDPFRTRDDYTQNPKDPGFRVFLPGTAGVRTNYFVRVRSASPNLANLAGGLTEGPYQFQIRLREIDEVPGSTVRYSNIRYATNGITVRGLPGHSPLLGEASDAGANDSVGAGSQVLGNLLNTDRAALGVSGMINTPNDVDVYRFDISYDAIQQQTGLSNPNVHLSTVIDVDYADGFARPDTSLGLFKEVDTNNDGITDSTQLVYISGGTNSLRNSMVADDQPGPLKGADIQDLSRGSNGLLDPYIGTFELAVGRYYLAVSSTSRMASELRQYSASTVANPLIRLEPINSVARIAEDRVDATGGSNVATAPQVDLLDANSFVPWHLGDVSLFVSRNTGEPQPTEYLVVDPFTGATEYVIGRNNSHTGDLATRFDGGLFAFSQSFFGVGVTDATSGNYLKIDPVTGQYTNLGDDGLQTYVPVDTRTNSGAGVGVQFNAMTYFGTDPLQLLAIGSRPDGYARNVLYQFNQQTGAGDSISSTTDDRHGCNVDFCLHAGAGTQIVERGRLSTVTGGLVPVDATGTNPVIVDGTGFRVNGRRFEFDRGPEVRLGINTSSANSIVRDGNFFILDNEVFQIDTGSTIVVNSNGAGIADGQTFTLQDNQGGLLLIELEDQGVADGQESPGSILVPYNTNMPRNAIASAIASAINSLPSLFFVQATAIENLVSLRNDTLVATTRPITITIPALSDLATSLTPILPAGAARQSLLLPSGGALQLVLPAAGGAGVTDGEQFTINDGATSLTFEFDNTGSLLNNTNIPVPFTTVMTPSALRASVRNVVAGAGLNITPSIPANGAPNDDRTIYIGGKLTTISTANPFGASHLAIIGTRGGLQEGTTVTISDGNATRTFEFSYSKRPGDSGANYVINVFGSSDFTSLANQITTQFNAPNSPVRLNAVDRGVLPTVNAVTRGVIQFSAGVQLEGELVHDAPIVRMARGGQLRDGMQFRVQTLDGAVLFEFDLNNALTAAGAVPIPFSVTDTAAVLASRVATAINAHTSAVAIARGDFLSINGQEGTLRQTPGSPFVLYQPLGTLAGVAPVVPVKNLVPDPNPATFNDIEGLLRGFEETDTNAQFAQNFLNRLNVATDITAISNTVGTPLDVTSANHGLGTAGVLVGVQGDPELGIPGQYKTVGSSVGVTGSPGFRHLAVWDTQALNANTVRLTGSSATGFSTDNYVDVPTDQLYDFLASYDSQASLINILGANNADFTGMPFLTDLGTRGGVSAGAVRVGILNSDDDVAIGNRIRDAVLRTSFPSVSVPVVGTGGVVTLNNSTVTLDGGSPLSVTNTGGGGDITGMAFIQSTGTLYAVSEQGDLYRVNNPLSRTGASLTLVAGLGVQFAGLVAGPPTVEGGRYANMLFGVTRGGVLMAFDTNGVAQPVFADARSQIATGVTNVNGIAFSNLDRNLWHVTTDRSNDPGHGINRAPDGSRNAAPGGASLHFGVSGGTYDFPGGAHGSLESNTFDLSGYQASDDPVLYFNYFAATDGTTFVPPSPRQDMLDSLRVFAADDSGEWQLLVTNDSYRGDFPPDEFHLGEFAVTQPLTGRRGVQEAYDNTNAWRQARVSLAPFAGRENVRLRFDFWTSGDSNTGDSNTTGSELRAIAGSELRDGQSFVVGGVRFEFDLGYTVVVPSALAIADQTILTVNGRRFEFDKGGGVTPGNTPVVINNQMSAFETTTALVNAIGAFVQVFRNGNRINMPGATAMTSSAPTVVQIDGAPGVSAGARAVSVNSGMADWSAAAATPTVRSAITQALATQFAGGDIRAIKTYREINRIIGRTVTDPGPLGLTATLQGDEFGDFNKSLTSRDNAREGIYLDDFIIGFAERGEMVTGATGDTSFSADPNLSPQAISVGGYDVEIRRGAQYGISSDQFPFLRPFRAFDTNERIAQSVTFIASAADRLRDGETFTLSDGVHKVTFEYEDQDVRNGVAPGNVAIAFDPTAGATRTPEPDYVIARRIRDAINSTEVQAAITITAALADGEVVTGQLGADSTSNRINLFGTASGDVVPTFSFGAIATDINGRESNGVFEPGFNGDQNRFRDQGQVLIQSNQITHASGFGIIVEAGDRNRADLIPLGGALPHQGSPRNLREINLSRLAPGATVTNNVLAYNNAGGIRVGGDTAPSNQDPAAVPFARVVNNTIYGDGGARSQNGLIDLVFVIDTSTPMSADIQRLKSQLPLLQAALVSAGLNANYALVEFGGASPTISTDGTALLTQPLVPFANFTAAGTPFSRLDALTDGTEPGSLALREAQNDLLPNTTVAFRAGATRTFVMLTDAPDASPNADFVTADQLLGNNGVFYAIADPNAGNSQAVYGTLATRHNGQLFDIDGYRDDPNTFFTAFVRTVVTTLTSQVGGTGILVNNNASPTLLNNIVSGLAIGLNIDNSSRSTVVGGTLYKDNRINTTGTLGDFPIVLGFQDPLFISARDGNFYPAAGSKAIDSSVDSLEDRAAMITVRNPVGIAPSPILAPARDVNGQLRADDPSVASPASQGANIFKDRGAVDRTDFIGPTTELARPVDNDTAGVDLDSAQAVVRLAENAVVSSFELHLLDNVPPQDAADGVGIDDRTVTSIGVEITRDGVPLVDGVDYSFSYNATSDTIRLSPLSGIWETNRIYVITLTNVDRFVITPPSGADILDGSSFEITDKSGTSRRFEFDSGYRLIVPQTLTLLVPPAGGGLGGITDGQTIVVRNGSNPPVTFEFNSDTTSLPGNIVIPLTSSDTQNDIANKLVTALSTASLGLGLFPRNLGNGVVHLGSNRGHVLNTANSTFRQTGRAVGVADGDTFRIDDGTKVVTFEFEDTQINNGTTAGNVRVNFNAADTRDDIAQRLVLAIRNANVGLDVFVTHRGAELNPVFLGNGELHIGGTTRHMLDTSSSTLTQLGAPGVSPPFGIKFQTRAGVPIGLRDGDFFALSDLSTAAQFELDNTGTATPGRIPIRFTATTTADQLADAIVSAIQSVGLGLTPAKAFNEAGLGAVALGGNATNRLVITGTSFQQLGQPGDRGAVPIVVSPIPSFDSRQVAVAVASAINTSPLTGVKASPGSGANVVIEGAASQADFDKVFARNLFIQSIKDLAGNSLKPNQANGDTRFMVVIGATTLDFGDAPDGVGTQPQNLYPTLLSSNGAAHAILNDGFYLGERRDAEFNSTPNAASTGDDVNGNGYTVNVAGTPGLSVSSAQTPLNLTVAANGGLALVDGQVFTITGAGETLTFEFENTLVGNGVAGTNFAVGFNPGQSRDELANAIVAAMLAVDTNLQLNPIYRGQGVIELSGDDEDGVRFLGPLNSFVSTPIDVTASVDGLLDGWVDFNRDGDWEDAGEQIFSSRQLVAGVNRELIATPLSAVLGPTFARFRFSSSGGLQPTGLTSGGEVEDYLINIVPGKPPIAVNDPGAGANPDQYRTDEDTKLNSSASLLTNDLDPDGDAFFVSQFDAVSKFGATVTVNGSANNIPGSGTFTYDPSNAAATPVLQRLAVGEQTVDSFTYTLSDGQFFGSPGRVDITVTGVNDAPTASAVTVMAIEDGAAVRGNFAGDDVDNDDDGTTLSYAIVTGLGTGQGSVVNNNDRTFTFNPGSDFQDLAVGETRTVTFTFQSKDRHGATSAPATVSVIVTGTNDRPVANDGAIAATEDGPTVTARFPGDDIDSDDNQATLVYSIANNLGAGQGKVTNNGDGTFTYDPLNAFQELPVGQTRTVTFTYRSRDSHAAQSAALGTISVTITGTNDAPDAIDNTYTTDEDSAITRNVITDDTGDGADSDIDRNDVIRVTHVNGSTANVGLPFLLPSGATLTLLGDGSFTFDPTSSSTFNALAVGQSASDSFTYTLGDGRGGSDVATVRLTIQGRNEAPVAVNETYTVLEAGTLNVNDPTGQVTPNNNNDNGVLRNDTDAENNPLRAVLVRAPAHHVGVFVLNADGTFTYKHDGADLPTDTFTYRAVDSEGGFSDLATVTINVLPVNDPPTGRADSYTVNSRGVLQPTDVLGNTTPADPTDNGVLANDLDPDSPNLTVRLVTAPSRGTLRLNSDGTFRYAHNGSRDEADRFSYIVNDGLADSGIVDVSITIVQPPPSVWQNQRNNLDVNDDGFISPIDVLLIVNYLNFNPNSNNQPLPVPSASFAPPPYLDVNGDGFCSALDINLVVSFLNTRANSGQGGGEGESLPLVRAAAGEGEGLDTGFNTGLVASLGFSTALASTWDSSGTPSGSRDVGPVAPPPDATAGVRPSARSIALSPFESALADIIGDVKQSLGSRSTHDAALELLGDEDWDLLSSGLES